MKKKLLVVVMLIVVILMAVLLAGCDTNKMTLGFMASADSDIEYVKVNIKDYEGKTLYDLLKAEESLEAQFNDYGVTEIKGLKSDDSHFISVYTTNEADQMPADEYFTPEPMEVDGVTYYVANGIKTLPISKYIKYLFVLTIIQY